MLQNKDAIKRIVVRLLNGQLQGCEFLLEPGRTLFLVTDDKSIALQHSSTVQPENIIYIPAHDDNNLNFEMIFSETHEDPVVLRIICDDDNNDKSIKDNELIVVGGLKLAWRDERDADFSIDINDVQNLVDEEDNIKSDEEIVEPDEEIKQSRKLHWWKIPVALGIVCCLAFAIFIYFTETQRQISSIEAILKQDANNTYQIIYGKDKLIYVFAKEDKAAEWAIQTMIRNPTPYDVSIVAAAKEEKRISQWVESQWPRIKIHRINLSEPKRPNIELSSERNKLNEEERKRFINAVNQQLPYAETLTLTELSDSVVRNLAKEGLNKMSLVFSEIKNKNSVTFLLRGSIEDGELERIKQFVNQFYQIWGTEYVQFALELKDDWLKGKSFKYGEKGYVKVAPGHWYFPKNLNKEY